MSAWEDELDDHPEYIDMLLEDKDAEENTYYCTTCKIKQQFYRNAADDCFHCMVCGTLFTPTSRRDRRFDTKKHTWDKKRIW